MLEVHEAFSKYCTVIWWNALVLKMEGEKKLPKNHQKTCFLQLKVEYEGNYIDYNCDTMSWAWLMPVNVFVSVFLMK